MYLDPESPGWVTVLYQGVPIGTGELTVEDDACFADIDALPAYAPIQPAMADALRALANRGFLPPGDAGVGGVTPEGDAAGRATLDRQGVVEAALELRDVRGTVLPTQSISLWDGGEGFSLMGWLDIAPAPSPAARRPLPPVAGEGHAPPAA